MNQGVTCYDLEYRLGSPCFRHPVILNDAARIGLMGSSSGGHLAPTEPL